MKLTKEQVRNFATNDSNEGSVVEVIKGEDRRWLRTNASIIKLNNGSYIRVYWEEGLTENQDNEYYEQEADFVVPVEKIIKFIEWQKA